MNTARLLRASARTAIIASIAAAGVAGAQTTTRIMVDGRTFEVEAGRAIVIRPDGTPGYAQADAPREVTTARIVRETPTSVERHPVAAAPAASESAFRAPDEEEGEAEQTDAPQPPAGTIVVGGGSSIMTPASVRAAVAVPTPTIAPVAQAPRSWARGLRVPSALADGSYPTPNRTVSRSAAVWHLRTALNVAALSCRGSQEARIVAGYNGLLGRRRTELAAAELALAKEYGANTKAGRASYDSAMTRLYNYWAEPAAQASFCAAAVEAIEEMERADGAGSAFEPLCATTLARLDRPFADFFREYDAWRRAGYTDMASAPSATAPTIQLASLDSGQ